MGTGPGDILQLIREGDAVTRGALIEATGLSRVTVSQRVDALLAAGVVREDGGAGSTGGRRATRFIFDPVRSIVAVASIDSTHAAVALVSPHLEVLARDHVDVLVADGPEVVLGAVLDAIDSLLSRAELAASELGAVAIAAPGPVDPVTHRFNEPPIMAGWNGWPVIETVRERFDVHVVVENDADAMAFGEYAALGRGPRPFVLVKVSSFIGAGIVIGGRIYRGFDGGAGDIGHVQVGGEEVCRCGRTGCLAAEASGAAIAQRLTAQGFQVRSGREVAALVSADVPEAVAEVKRAGELIGRVVATVVGVLNPASIVVAGALAFPLVVAGIRTGVYAGSLPRATRHLDILPARLGPDAAIVGLAAVAVDDRFTAAAVNARLAE